MREKFKRLLRESERGQSVIILAIAFIVLCAFVGLTTDISLMFVRFATLRRAVDSASIAAATQMRQGQDEVTVALSARQFIELHGLDSVDVLVDTCQTLDPSVPEQDEEREILCTPDQRKLVKVTAQVESPTIFLRLVGWQNFTLEAAAISETAALDVVVIMDVSESMLNETSYADWASIGQGYIYKPPRVNDIINAEIANGDFVPSGTMPPADEYWRTNLLSEPQEVITERLTFNDPTGQHPAEPADDDPNANYPVEVRTFDGGLHTPPREACRVRFMPFSTQQNVSNYKGPNGESLRTYYQNLGDPLMVYSSNLWGGFVPTYNFYGCCNDPTTGGYVDPSGAISGATSTDPDFRFDDLICQPFKGARDATEEFIERIDFIRGDRVAFVTFDRTAFLINPYGEDSRTAGFSHMMDNFLDARTTLRSLIGVRSEPNFYVYDVPTGTGLTAGWTGFAAGLQRDATGQTESVPIDYEAVVWNTGPTNNEPLAFTYPALGACPFQNAAMGSNQSLFNLSLADIAHPYPSVAQLPSRPDYNPDWENYVLDSAGVDFGDFASDSALFSYELWASCRGTNMGSALREANNALLDPTTSRRFGTVWVMVMLSDGAAGASDPVRRNGGKLDEAQPYATNATNTSGFGIVGDYGSFGVCPYGRPYTNEAGELVDVMVELDEVGMVFPFCSDEVYYTRHDCDFRPKQGEEFMRDIDYYSYSDAVANGDDDGINGPASAAEELSWNLAQGNLYDVDLDTCSPLYDVDDYARDWADFIGIQDTGDELLPTIFTIGFGLTFPNGSNTCAENVGDCLGEELLRYIADVGDNNLLDNDYYQSYDEHRPAVEGVIADFGQRGACQDPANIPPGGDYDLDGSGFLQDNELEYMYGPLPPTTNCGHYYNAPNADELQLVFDAIASRMFTRLAG